MDEKELTRLFFERSEQAISALEAAYGPLAKALAFNVLGDPRDAEECLSDGLLAVWNSVPPTRPESMKAYLLALTRNCALDRYHRLSAKKRNSHYDTALDELNCCLPELETAETLCEAKALGEAINAFLSTLEKEDRQLFVRRFWLGQELGEIARALGISPQRASLRLFRTKDKLKRYLMKEGMLEWTKR